jgi:hypothetical protein
MPDKKDDTKTTIVESAAKGGMTAAMPYIFLGGAAYLGYRYLSEKTTPSNIAGGVNEHVKELVKTTIDTIKDSTKTVIDRTNQLIDEGNDNPILKFITPDIQSDPTGTGSKEDIALENYKKGNVTTKTAAAENSLYNILFGEKTINSIDVGSIKTPSQAMKEGLRNAPLSINKPPKQNVFKFELGSESPLAQSKKDKLSSNEIGQISNNANTNTSKVKVTRDKNTGRYSVSVPKGKKIKVVRRFS